jgi:hypothetical protein
MSVTYAGLTAPQLLALLAVKRKEEDELIAALKAVMGDVRLSAPAKGGAGAGAGAGARKPAAKARAKVAPAPAPAPASAPAAAAVLPTYVGKFVDDDDDDLASYAIWFDIAKFDKLSVEEKSHFCTLTSLGISDAEQAAWRALHAREDKMAKDLTEEGVEEQNALEEELDKVHILIIHALRRKAASA